MSSSAWIASSLMIFSTRAISWTWNRTVSKHSNTRVMTGPSATRRSTLRAMILAR